MNRFFKGSICMLALSSLVSTVSAQATGSDAYQAAMEANPTGAVEIITADRIEKYGFSTTEALVGQFASLNGLQIRGSRSTNASEALTLIDGFESDFTNVEVEDIETIQVLKDAAATAKYGVRGANGVILITTKRGYKNDAPDVKLKIQSGFTYTSESPDMVNGSTYNGIVSGLSGVAFSNETDINWVDEMIKPIVAQMKATAQVSGGTDNARYYISAMYQKTGSEYNHDTNAYSRFSGSDQINFRSNLDIDIDKNTTWSVLASATIGTAYTPEVTDYLDLLYSTPASRYEMYSTLNGTQYFYGTSQYDENPLGEFMGKGYTKTNSRLMTVQTKLDHKMDYLVEGLSAKIQGGFKSDGWGVEQISTSYLYSDGETLFGEYEAMDALTRSAANGSWDQNRWQSYLAGFGYDRTFDSENSLSAELTAQYDTYVWSTDVDRYNYFNLLASATYNHGNRYVAQLSATYGGSNFSDKFIVLPTAGFAWNISNEDFWSGNSSLKLRASVGMLGSDEIGDATRFMYLSRYYEPGTNYRFGTNNTASGTIAETAFPYSGTYEKSIATNIGLDAKLFDNSLSLSVDYFNETRYDIYQTYTTEISSTWGGTIPVYNYGRVHSQGVELNVNYHKAINSDLTLSAGLIAGYSRNIITQAYEYDNPYYSIVGGGVDQNYGLTADGIYQESDFTNGVLTSGAQPTYGSVQAGDIKYKDLNNDNVIDSKDISGLSSDSNPINLGLNLDLKFKGFNFGLLFDSQLNSTTDVMDNIIYSPLANGYDNVSTYAYENAWSATNTGGTLPRLSTTESSNNSQLNSIYVVSTNYLRLRTAMVGYTFPVKIAGAADKFIGVNLCAHNLFTLDSLPKSMSATNLDYDINGSYVTFSVDFTF